MMKIIDNCELFHIIDENNCELFHIIEVIDNCELYNIIIKLYFIFY